LGVEQPCVRGGVSAVAFASRPAAPRPVKVCLLCALKLRHAPHALLVLRAVKSVSVGRSRAGLSRVRSRTRAARVRARLRFFIEFLSAACVSERVTRQPGQYAVYNIETTGQAAGSSSAVASSKGVGLAVASSKVQRRFFPPSPCMLRQSACYALCSPHV
jgi:hypothetical protein